MKKNAFTLAEVLIALAIVGVVAAVTLPAVSSNVQKNKVGPGLAKAINNLENANKIALNKWNARSISEAAKNLGGGETSYFDRTLAITNSVDADAILKAEKLTAQPSYAKYKKYNSSNAYTSVNGGTYYIGIDGIDYIRPPENGYKLFSVSDDRLSVISSSYSGRYYKLYVDVDGMKKGPNTIGRDLFLLYIDDKGEVIPYGSQAYVEYTGDSANSWENKCKEDNDPSKAESCTGAIVDNRFKVRYNY